MDRAVRDLADEYIRRLEAGEKITIEGWCAGYPDVAADLRVAIEAVTNLDATVQAKAPASEEDHSQTPLFDSRYRVLKTLGEGGFGKVYLVADTFHHDEQLALKLIKAELQQTEAFTKRFQLEIRVLRALHHDGIPPIYNDGVTSDGEVYFTMAFVKGRSLQDIMRDGKGLSPLDVANYVRQMVSTLNYAHAQGVVHRDLKPANVLIAGEGTDEVKVLILDFGIAKVLKDEAAFEAPMTMQTEMPIGTPHYMAPEQVRGQEVDGKTDLYALGIMIYRMVAGGFPFKGNTSMEIMVARMHEKPTPLSSDTEPSWAAPLVKELLSRQKEQRPSIEQIQELISETKGTRRLQKQTMVIAASALIGVVLLAARPWQWGAESDVVQPPPGVTKLADGTSTPPEEGGESQLPNRTDDAGEIPGTSGRIEEDTTTGTAIATATITLVPEVQGPRIFQSSPSHITGSLQGNHEGGIEINGKHVIVEPDGSFKADLELEEGTTELVMRDLQQRLIYTEPIQVDLSAPELDLQVPEMPILTREHNYRVFGRATDSQGVASLEGEGSAIIMDSSGAFEYPVNFTTEGPYTAKFEAKDKAGRTSTSEVIFIVDWSAPKVTFDQTPPTTTIEDSFTLSGVASDTNGVQLLLNGAAVLLSSSGHFEQVLPLELGNNSLQLMASDDAGSVWNKTLEIRREVPLALLPAGCTEAPGSGTRDGWALEILHTRSGLKLLHVPATNTHDAFYVGQTEVSRQQYKRISDLPTGAAKATLDEDHPVTKITIQEAWTWCQRAGLRLPTAQEWVRAAGPKNYPWGDEWDAARCNYDDTGAGTDTFVETCPVEAMPEDLSPYGALGMAGNVREWCTAGLMGPNEVLGKDNSNMLGGSFDDGQADCKTNTIRKLGRIPGNRKDIGFRVVIDATE